MEGKSGFANLPSVHHDKKVVEAGLYRLGFQKHEIEIIVDPDMKTLKSAISKLTLAQLNNYHAKPSENTLIYVYYAGHGQ